MSYRPLEKKYYGVSWDENTETPSAVCRTGALSGVAVASKPDDSLIPIQAAMRRCVVDDSGNVVYYLDPEDSTKKQGGGAANLDGTDGQVMVECPKFYYRHSYSGTIHTWDISLFPLEGFILHPAFQKDGAVVDFRYPGAYEAVLYDVSESIYSNGLYLPSSATYTVTFGDNGGADDTITADVLTHPFTNLEADDVIVVSGSTANDGTYTVKSATDNVITLETGSLAASTANDECVIQTQKDWTAASGDKLCSISGKAPTIQGTRAQFREVALNRGVGWRMCDFDLVSAIQLLYLVEYASFYSQSMIGAGLTDWSSADWNAWNDLNPIEVTGNSNSDGNHTANVSGGSGVTGSYMSYRGIENAFGHLWKWVDGFNINDNIPYVSNTESHFADDTTTNYTRLEDSAGNGITLPSENNYQITLEQTRRGFLPASVGAGGGSTKYITDYYYQSTGWRVAMLGGAAHAGGTAGFFYWYLYYSSGHASRAIGGRLCR
jgi:hypothetical protein